MGFIRGAWRNVSSVELFADRFKGENIEEIFFFLEGSQTGSTRRARLEMAVRGWFWKCHPKGANGMKLVRKVKAQQLNINTKSFPGCSEGSK